MRMLIAALCLIGIGTSLTGAVASAQDLPKATKEALDIGVMRALPGVFKVHTFGDLNYSAPAKIAIATADLDEAYRQGVTAGEIPKELSESDAKWLTLVRDPDRFLKPSPERLELQRTDVETGYGSAFAVSREGILLTNRHVVEAKEDKPFEAENVATIQPPSFEKLLQDLVAHIGKLPAEPTLQPFIVGRTLGWFGFQCRKTTTFRRAEVSIALAMQDPLRAGGPDVAFQFALQTTIKSFGMDARTGVRLPVTVVARGAEGFENDVAILKLQPGTAHDAVICLALANPQSIVAGQKVWSLGFPGFKYDEERMTQAELYRVNVEPGAVKFFDRGNGLSLQQRLKASLSDLTLSNQKLLIVSAIIRPGSSGGPIVMEDGRVAGLNVCYRLLPERQTQAFPKFAPKTKMLFSQPNEASLDMGVPIATAQQMLAANQITLDVGPTTQTWHDGLALFQAGQYAEADAKFREVARRQVSVPAGKPYGPKTGKQQSIVSHYVQEMMDRCEQRRRQ